MGDMTLTWVPSDSINAVFGFPMVYDNKIIDAARLHGTNAILLKIARLPDSLVQLRDLLERHNKSTASSDSLLREIDQKWTNILQLTQDLRANASENNLNPYVEATSISGEILLWLCWRNHQSFADHLAHLAEQLKQAISRFPFRPCSFTEMTSCQMMLGALAARPDSDARAWFVAKFTRAVAALRARGWEKPLGIVRGRVQTEMVGVGRAEELWEEVELKHSMCI